MILFAETAGRYLTNLTPSDFPRRQTTSQRRPDLASRENASRSLPASALASSTVIFAPVEDMSCTTHRRAAKPPSRVIHPDCCTDLRAARFLVCEAISCLRRKMLPVPAYPRGALETVAIPLRSTLPASPAHLHFACKTSFRAACPGAQTPLYVRPPPVRPHHHGPWVARCQRGLKALICRLYLSWVQSEAAMPRPGRSQQSRRFRSLRLSVRTPPFHGGESGSIPLGSATGANGP